MSYDFVQNVNSIKSSLQDFVIDPIKWNAFKTSINLNWHSVYFTKDNKSKIPKKRGIYIFMVKHNNIALPEHGYIVYVGITGDSSSETLNSRYDGYLQEKKRFKRPKIYYMLRNWEDGLYFYYAIISDKRYSLKKLESDLCDALIPPCNQNDFSATVRREVRAL